MSKKKRIIEPYRDDTEKENAIAAMRTLEQLKEAELEKEYRAMKLLEDKLYEAIDEALYGDGLNHADVLDAIMNTLRHFVFETPTSSCGPTRA